jgi:hypothetical protein
LRVYLIKLIKTKYLSIITLSHLHHERAISFESLMTILIGILPK